MEKDELVEFLKEEHQRIEDVLYKLGEIKEIKTKLENHHITDRFRDALMFLNHGKLDDLKGLLERAAKQKWL